MTDKKKATEQLAVLLARVALSDRASFAQLYGSTRRELFAVAYRVLGRRETAEDALQDAFVNIWHHAANYRVAASQPMTWMTSIVRNKALDILRSEGKHPQRALGASVHDAEEQALQIAAPEPEPPELFAQAIESLGIRRCMEALDPAQRQALSLAYYRGLSHSEIAESMGARRGTAIEKRSSTSLQSRTSLQRISRGSKQSDPDRSFKSDQGARGVISACMRLSRATWVRYGVA